MINAKKVSFTYKEAIKTILCYLGFIIMIRSSYVWSVWGLSNCRISIHQEELNLHVCIWMQVYWSSIFLTTAYGQDSGKRRRNTQIKKTSDNRGSIEDTKEDDIHDDDNDDEEEDYISDEVPVVKKIKEKQQSKPKTIADAIMYEMVKSRSEDHKNQLEVSKSELEVQNLELQIEMAKLRTAELNAHK